MRWPSDAPRSSARVGSSASSGSSSCVRRHAPAVPWLPAEAAWRIASTESSVPVDLVHDPAAAEHQGAVADVGDLLEVGGDHQDGEAARAGRRRAGA